MSIAWRSPTGTSPEFVEVVQATPASGPVGSRRRAGRVLERRIIHIHDAMADPEYALGRGGSAAPRSGPSSPFRCSGRARSSASS